MGGTELQKTRSLPHRLRTDTDTDRAITPVVATVLIIAMLLIIIGVFYIWVSGVMHTGGLNKQSTPAAIFALHNSDDTIEDNDPNDQLATVTLDEGSLLLSEIEVLVSHNGDLYARYDLGPDAVVPNSDEPEYWNAGESLVVEEGALDDSLLDDGNWSSEDFYIRVKYNPTDKIIYSDEVTLEGAVPSQYVGPRDISGYWKLSVDVEMYWWEAPQNESVVYLNLSDGSLSGMSALGAITGSYDRTAGTIDYQFGNDTFGIAGTAAIDGSSNSFVGDATLTEDGGTEALTVRFEPIAPAGTLTLNAGPDPIVDATQAFLRVNGRVDDVVYPYEMALSYVNETAFAQLLIDRPWELNRSETSDTESYDANETLGVTLTYLEAETDPGSGGSFVGLPVETGSRFNVTIYDRTAFEGDYQLNCSLEGQDLNLTGTFALEYDLVRLPENFVDAWSHNRTDDADDDYIVFRYYDPDHRADSVNVTGDHIDTDDPIELEFDGVRYWDANLSVGTLEPTTLPFNYTFTIENTTNDWTWTGVDAVYSFLDEFATELEAYQDTQEGVVKFNWTPIDRVDAAYIVYLSNDSNGELIWISNDGERVQYIDQVVLEDTSLLEDGQTYYFEVVASINEADAEAVSVSTETLTWQEQESSSTVESSMVN